MNELEKVLNLIGESNRVLITSHQNPDGDALGSMLALGLGLEKIGKDVVFYSKDGVPEILEFLPHSDK
ncbi:MAG: bifunctional oligoribonuclease/PAP phosphatase NrnA, partial [Deltaproteobacteria bacterium]|nr:bifunctional oligoribonuclease/PAP phosphatase NrnA [Deltaproteobacteria bacterium]